jgi:hypothetical protein
MTFEESPFCRRCWSLWIGAHDPFERPPDFDCPAVTTCHVCGRQIHPALPVVEETRRRRAR